MKTFEKISFNGQFRDYQQRVLNNADRYLSDGKINIVAAPGSGKTILGLELIRRLNSPVIILSPTTTIKHQWGERFKEKFLTKGDSLDDYVSYNLHEIKLINSITYQALDSIIRKKKVAEEDGDIDYSDIEVFELINKFGIKTICLDEAHHLQNQWQKSLEILLSNINADIKVISLTATPPYDTSLSEWDRYMAVCGPIDEEIYVPELVKENTLCPHQDYVYFNYPTKEEVKIFKEYKNNVLLAINALCDLDIYEKLYVAIKTKFREDTEDIYLKYEQYQAIITLLIALGIEVDAKIREEFVSLKKERKLNLALFENAFQFILDEEHLISQDDKERVISTLNQYSVIERGKIIFSLKEQDKHKLISSKGKLESIKRIFEFEYKNMGDQLRMLILTDYIKKDALNNSLVEDASLDISVVSIFKALYSIKSDANLGVLSGNLIILPSACEIYCPSKYVKVKQIADTNYSEFVFNQQSNKEKICFVSNLFEKGIINVLIGTKSLLGEGWDSPCINTLILASFVGSFVLSNQMRGRAIRIDKNNSNKISNIWHLVTVEPEYIFKDSFLTKLNSITDFNNDSSYDFDTISRRFDCFVGPNYETGEIESGIGRLSIITKPFNKKSISNINSKMIERACNRESVAKQWTNALNKSAKLIDELNVPYKQIIRPFSYLNLTGLLISSMIEVALSLLTAQCISAIISETAKNISNHFLYIILVFLTIGIIIEAIGIGQVIKIAIKHSSPIKIMSNMATATLNVFKKIGSISNAAKLKITSNSFSINIQLTDSTCYEQYLFNTAIKEMFSPIKKPKYILVFKRPLTLDFKHSFACPTFFSQEQSYITLFKKSLSQCAGNFEIIYTRTQEGRQMLNKCRSRSLITKDNRLLKNTKKTTL